MSFLSGLFSRKKGKPVDREPLVDGADLASQLFAHQGSSLWLGRYPEARVAHAFEKYGVFPEFRRMGMDRLKVEVSNLDLFLQSLKIYDGDPDPGNLLIEMRVREATLAPVKRFDDGFGRTMPRMLAIEWLLLQNPRASFRQDRPPLPGQQYPGLGLSRQVMTLLIDTARRLGLEGVVYHPAFYHNARFAPSALKFYNPRWEGRMAAIDRDLGSYTTCEISWAFELGCIARIPATGPFPWQSNIQIFPLSRRVRDYLLSPAHLHLREKAIADEQFYLDADKFRDLYGVRVAESHGRITTPGDADPRRTPTVPGGSMADHRSLYQLFRTVVSENPDSAAYMYKKDDTWHPVTWTEQEAACKEVSRALMSLGLKHGDRVCILSDTRLEWTQADFGTHSCGGVTVGIYPSNLAEDCAYIINHSDAEIIIVENADQLAKIVGVREKLPALRHIVIIDGPGDPANGVLSWSEFLEKASSVPEEAFRERADAIAPDDLASLVYTSGTTGIPKGAMLTHKNMLFTARSSSEALGIESGQCTLLFLPLAHVFARLVVYFTLQNAVTVAFAESILTVGDNLREIRPHFIASVPRIFEKVYDKIVSGAQEAGGIKAKLFGWAVATGLKVSRLKQKGEPVPGGLGFKYGIAEKLVFKKIQAALGGRMKWAVSGAAPLNKTVAEFFHACGILIVEGLGMTENASFTNCNRYERYKFGTVGPTGPGIEMKLAGDGEIMFRGDNVMKGYFKNPEATAETIDADGWLHTGDVGEIDTDGFLKITDRKKDLIITAGGKNIAPQRIEGVLCTSRFISQVMAYGDQRKFITALVALNLEAVEPWAVSEGIQVADRSELPSHPKVAEMVEKEVENLNAGLASFETVKKFRILPRELSVEEGELTPSLKIKRRVVVERYGDLIEEMYRE